MANLCDNEVILLGNPAQLQKVYDAYQRTESESLIEKKTVTLERIQEILGFKCEGWGRSYDEGVWSCDASKIDGGELRIGVCTANSPVDAYWAALAEAYGLKWAACGNVDGEYWITNDVEGRYFLNRYILEIWDENDYFDTSYEWESATSKDIFVAMLNNISKDNTFRTYEEWIEIFDDCDFGAIRDVICDGEQATNPYIPGEEYYLVMWVNSSTCEPSAKLFRREEDAKKFIKNKLVESIRFYKGEETNKLTDDEAYAWAEKNGYFNSSDDDVDLFGITYELQTIIPV